MKVVSNMLWSNGMKRLWVGSFCKNVLLKGGGECGVAKEIPERTSQEIPTVLVQKEVEIVEV